MSSNKPRLTRLPITLRPDPRRVIARFFGSDDARNRRRLERILSLPEDVADRLLCELEEDYSEQHRDLVDIWLEHFERVAPLLPVAWQNVSKRRQLLAGAYFTMEYAIESSALFNPSIVPLPDQSPTPPGTTRFLMSLRATGEGHISSVVFRRGSIDRNNYLVIEEAGQVTRPLADVPDAEFDTSRYRVQLAEAGFLGPLEEQVLERLGLSFSMEELERELLSLRAVFPTEGAWEQTHRNMLSVARSSYKLLIGDDVSVSEAVIFPRSENESRGIEDLRLVLFTEEDGFRHIYGTYTAYNGTTIFPTLMETSDLRVITIATLTGRCARNKGMALFPRRIGGRYVCSGRIDGENLYIMYSDNILVWNEAYLAMEPLHWWEFSVIGNCGSPIETPEGWLLLTHGVGPMRQYCIGAALLDLKDPTKVLGRSREPLIAPEEDERSGYVPNVVYTCGAMRQNDVILIPYALSDHSTTFAFVSLEDLLASLE